jgi:hypothetical protein
MKHLRNLILVSLLGFMQGCATQYLARDVNVSSSGQRFCARDGAALVREAGYEPDDSRSEICPSRRWSKLKKIYPNSKMLGFQTNKDDFAILPCGIEYCPECESELQKGLK